MRAILPGKPQAALQAISVGSWSGKQIVAYITGNASVIFGGPNDILQTIYQQDKCDLVAIQLDEASGKIATCSNSTVHIYKPGWTTAGLLEWTLQCDLPLQDLEVGATTLSWGLEAELLVGSSCLTLFSTGAEPERIWTTLLSSPAKLAQFSSDAGLIASTGRYDRLLKVWRRLTFASATERFDSSYLPHPATITGIHWRRPFHREQSVESILYTICADKKIRIWSPAGPSELQGMRLWAELDLLESINPRNALSTERSQRRYAFVIDSRDFTIATERAVQQAENTEKEQQALAHLIEVANRNPEVVVVVDDRGNMSAWGLENVGCKTRKATDIFNIAHVDGLNLHIPADVALDEVNIQFQVFCGEGRDSAFTMLAHHFDGRVDWFEGRIDELLDLSPRQNRLRFVTSWTGHSAAVKKINRTASGRALASRATSNETIVWRQRTMQYSTALSRQSSMILSEYILRTCLLQEGDFIMHLHRDCISLWDARASKAKEVARCQYRISGEPLCLILIPETKKSWGYAYVATVSSEMKGVAWEVRFPAKNLGINGHQNGSTDPSIEQFCTFDLGADHDICFVLPVDPAGLIPVISGFLDIFARDILLTCTRSGMIKTWTTKVNKEARKMEWLLTSTVQTAIDRPTLASASSIRKTALVDAEKTGLTIWDTRSCQLEYEEHFDDQGIIQDLDWASTPDDQSILAVGFPHQVVIYAQLRYDYLDAGPSWASIRQISISELTPHPIGDSVWLGSGNLVMGAGNQLFVQDEHVQLSESILPDLRLAPRKAAAENIFALVSWLNGPLPVFHAQFLTQCILAGKLIIVHRILVALYQKLKHSSECDELDTLLGLTPDDFSDPHEVLSVSRKEMSSSYADFSDNEEPAMITEEVATSLNEILTRIQIPHLSRYEQFRLADVIECVGTVEKHRRSIDENGCRFLAFFRQHSLRESRRSGEQNVISWREITWAYHSDSQDILVDLVSRHYHGKMLWRHARESGMFMWLTDLSALRAQFEIIARNEYTKTEEKNPVDCSLYYLALKKKAVLVGLWRMATWSREQGATQRLLKNDFNEPRWKTAALKNAYALMGKRRFDYAAAFFLLAGSLKDAISVLSSQMRDPQLAIAVARVYEGDDGPMLREFLEDKILPQAAKDGNRWMATWAFWMLSRRDKAVRALVTPLYTLLTPSESPSLHSKLFLTDDPALVVLYKQLREKSVQTLRGAVMVLPKMEWEFVVHTARLYSRMGCDILALDLVRNWEFLVQPPPALPPLPTKFTPHSPLQSKFPTSPFENADFDPRKLLRRRSSLVIADLPPPSSPRLGDAEVAENGAHEERSDSAFRKLSWSEKEGEDRKEKKQPTKFTEPDANSLLDAFGF